ncbi:MAG: zinc-binding dehydrogenase [Deltaproteobacteria bacterium]|nr:zinc-binding dehydrogenase [Deltaproteobacteria bacterium]
MRALLIERHGGAEVLAAVERPLPEPGPGEVRVRVTHVGLNHLDVWVRKGVPGHHFPLPMVPGSDIVGVREDTGEAVAVVPFVSCGVCDACVSGRHDLCRAYRIRGEGMDGGCQEAVVVPEASLLPLGALDPAEAASMPLALLTAWHMLVTRAKVQVGDTVLVQAGASGVGSFAIQIARLFGARVVATASTDEKRALCRALGAEEAWSYEEAPRALWGWSGKRGVDIVVEHVGAATWEASVRAAKWGGTVVTCGATSGHQVSLDLRGLFFKQLSLLGSTMGSMGEMRAAWAAVQRGQLRPVLDRVLPMSALGEAHALLENRAVSGKVVVAQDLRR